MRRGRPGPRPAAAAVALVALCASAAGAGCNAEGASSPHDSVRRNGRAIAAPGSATAREDGLEPASTGLSAPVGGSPAEEAPARVEAAGADAFEGGAAGAGLVDGMDHATMDADPEEDSAPANVDPQAAEPVAALPPPPPAEPEPAPEDGCARTFAVPGSTPAATRKVADLTGAGTSSARFGVGGSDLGIPVRQPDGRIAYIFGDTFELDTVGGPGWRSPVLLRSRAGLAPDGIEFESAAGGDYARQILDYSHAEGQTWLPTAAITIDDRMYLHYAVNQGLGNVLWTQIAFSDDNGESWTVSGARWEAGDADFLRQQWTWERGCDGYVYVMSTKFVTRDRPIILHRVPEDRLLEPAAYEPWGYAAGQWAWGNPPTPVLEGAFGELSLRRVEDRWVLAYFDAGGYRVSIKVFDSPTSNLYEAATYHPLLGGAWGAESDTTVAQLYGGFIHPDSTLHELHLIVSQWNTSTDWPYRAMQFVTSVE